MVGALALLWSLLLLAWLTLYWGILPHIDDWRPRVEALASRALGAPVRIGSIQVRSGGWIPAAELREVVLHDAQGREALRLPRVAAALSVPALLALELRFEQLLIEDAHVEIRRDGQGRLWVAGLALGDAGQQGDDHAAADWFFRQHEFVIRGGSLSWTDEPRGAPPLQLSDAVVVVRNGLLRHDLRIDATPQAEWGERFSIRAQLSQPLMARAGDWRQWRGTLHAELPHVDLARLRQYVELPFELRQGRGALRAWLEVDDGVAGAATVDLALRDVALRLAPQVAGIEFEYLRARLDGERSGSQTRVAARRLAFATADGLVWPESMVEASWRTASGAASAAATGEVVAGELSADRLQLAHLASLAARVPLGDGVRRLLAELAPRGSVNDLVARWDGPLDAPRQYQVRARMKGLSLAAAPVTGGGVGRPGWLNADVDLQASELGGEARLALADGVIEFPGVFESAAVPLRRFDAQLAWRIGAPRPNGRTVELHVKEARFENDDAAGELSAHWRSGDGVGFGRAGRFPGVLDLQGKLSQGQATSVARYLPLGLPKAAREYVQHAVLGGKVSAATFKVKGDLYDFPFYGAAASRGEFRIAGKVSEAALAYVPSHPGDGDREPPFESPWPAITRGEGELVFDRSSMSIRNGQGRIFGVELRGVQGGVRDFAEQPTLEIEGQARGPLADMLRYVDATPVGEWIGGALAQAVGQGAAELRLGLQIPFQQPARTSVKGSLTLAGNDIRLRPDTPLLGAARGRVDFTQRGVQIVGGSARVIGGEASFDGGTQGDGSLRFSAQGSASAEGLRRAVELGPASRLAQAMQGQAAYRLSLGFVKGRVEYALTSNLTGIAINLPPPLAKAAEQPLALRVQSTLQPESLVAGASPRDQLRVELGSVVQAVYQRDVAGDTPRVLRSAVGVNAPAPAATSAGQAQAEFTTLNLDAWRQAWTKLQATAAGLGVAAAPGPGAGDGYLPRIVRLRARELNAGSRRFTAVAADLTRSTRDDDEVWRAQVNADQLAGAIEYREPRAAAAAGRIQARLSRLSLPPVEGSGSEPPPEATASTSVPALDIAVDDFEVRGKRLGRLEIEAINRAGAGDGAREWQLNRLALRTPEAQLTASGQWMPAAGSTAPRRTALDFQLELADSGAYLERLGYGKTMRGGKGRLQGQIGWSGSPFDFDPGALDGSMKLSLDAGQFLKADAGAARLLGVLSLQALPRRLMLDFRDVFQEGFAFDNIDGDFRIAGGVLTTRNLRMRGVQAAVLMEGQADIGLETQDLRVLVVPEINAGTASLAYAAINPALGLGTFVAQWLLRRPLIAANTREFHITGRWDDPKIERVERPSTDAASTGDDGRAAAAPAPAARP